MNGKYNLKISLHFYRATLC